MKYGWEKYILPETIDKIAETADLPPGVRVLAVVFAYEEYAEACAIASRGMAGVPDADMLQDAIGDLDAMRIFAFFR